MAASTMKQIVRDGLNLVPDIDPHETRISELRDELETKLGHAEHLHVSLTNAIEALDCRDSSWLESTLENVQANLANLK